MIASLTGTLTAKSATTLTIEVSGIGYQVFVPLSTFYHLPEVKETASLNIYTHVREDALQLYGFLTSLEKETFLLLLSISGIGPKLALNILSGLEIADLIIAIRDGNLPRLRGIPGVGPKTAGRIILELKDKVTGLNLSGLILSPSLSAGEDPLVEDALSALINLGYPRGDAKKALEQMQSEMDGPPTAPASVAGLIKQALKRLSRLR